MTEKTSRTMFTEALRNEWIKETGGMAPPGFLDRMSLALTEGAHREQAYKVAVKCLVAGFIDHLATLEREIAADREATQLAAHRSGNEGAGL